MLGHIAILCRILLFVCSSMHDPASHTSLFPHTSLFFSLDEDDDSAALPLTHDVFPHITFPHTSLFSPPDEDDDSASLPPSPYELEEEGWTGGDDPDYERFDGETCRTQGVCACVLVR
jgi:hypothetical protein